MPHVRNVTPAELLHLQITAPDGVHGFLEEYAATLPELGHNLGPVAERPWMLVNWPFLDKSDEILGILEQQGTPATESFDITGYTSAARHLYPYSRVVPDDFDTWGYYAVSRLVPPTTGESGTVLLFDDQFLEPQQYEQITEAKRAIRRVLGSVIFTIISGDEALTTDFRACHAPDHGNIGKELEVVHSYKLAQTSCRPNLVHLPRESITVTNTHRSRDQSVFAPLPLHHRIFHDPVTYLLCNSTQVSGVENLYQNTNPERLNDAPLVVLLQGPSGAGKDSIITALIEDNGFGEAKAATSRAPRLGYGSEDIDKYVWMRNRKANESDDEYQAALEDEYKLLESAYHNGNLYGLPRASLDESLITNKVTLLVTDNDAAACIKEYVAGRANCITVFVVPDSYEDLWVHIRNLDDSQARINEAAELIAFAPDSADYYIHNSRSNSGLERAVSSVRHLINLYTTEEQYARN